MAQTINLPKCLNVKFDGTMEEREQVMDDMMNDAFTAAQPELVEKLGKIQGVDERIQEAYEGKEIDTEEWLSHQIAMILYAYMSHRTGIIALEDSEDKKDVTKPFLSTVVSDASEILGSKATQELLRTLSYHADTVIEERFGRELA